MTLTEFLLARIAEDETDAADAAQLIHIPADRLLAECEAKRRIVDDAVGVFGAECGPLTNELVHLQVTVTLELLALPYADHPDYREEWKP